MEGVKLFENRGSDNSDGCGLEIGPSALYQSELSFCAAVI